MDRIKLLTKAALALVALSILMTFCVPDRRPIVRQTERQLSGDAR